MIEIRSARLDEMDRIRALLREYSEMLGVDLCFQNFDEELATLPGRYAKPRGELLIAMSDHDAAGCIALRQFREEAEICEMKRLFVPVRHHGRGLGRLLCGAIMLQAKADGFGSMRLDAAKAFTEARRLYGSMGFVECAPYIDYPSNLMATMVFMEAKLA